MRPQDILFMVIFGLVVIGLSLYIAYDTFSDFTFIYYNYYR
jgi:hypothetical protein